MIGNEELQRYMHEKTTRQSRNRVDNMNYCKKFIFIKENNSLIMELGSTKKDVVFFINGISECLIQEELLEEQPIKITMKAKKSVINFLQCKYSFEKRINKLIHFLSSIEEESYVYFYPYSDDGEIKEIYDLLEKSLEYYNQGYTQEEIADKMRRYNLELKKVKNVLSLFPYLCNEIVPIRKIVIGESDKLKRRCIYCGGIQGDGKTSFKGKAHAISEALGNKKFIQNEECDSCNEYFAENAEEDFGNMLMFNRLKYGLKGKSGYPVFQLGPKKYARFFDWEKENYENDWGYFEKCKELVKQKQLKGPVIVDVGGDKKIDEQINISSLKGYVPMHVYKTLVKCVIGLIGNGKLNIFEKTIQWLRYDESFHKLPKVAILKCRRLIKEPELYIFERKDETNYNLPYCYGELRVLEQIFVFIIPFCTKDKKKFTSANEFLAFEKLIGKIYENYELCDFSDISYKSVSMYLQRIGELT